MTNNEKLLIREFFSYVTKLHEAKIARSDNLLGDIGEWICVSRYGLVLTDSRRNPGFDGYINGKKIQVKMHNSPTKTNLLLGEPEKYDEAIVIVGPRSLWAKPDPSTFFYVYRFSALEVKTLMRRRTGYYCAKTTLRTKTPDLIAI